jgi:hypothetical protein
MPPFLRVGGGLPAERLAERRRPYPRFSRCFRSGPRSSTPLGGDDALTGPITYFGALFVWAFASFVAGVSDVWTAGVPSACSPAS